MTCGWTSTQFIAWSSFDAPYGLHYLGGFLVVLADQPPECVRAQGARHHALGREALEDHRIAQQLRHLGVDALDDAPRRARRREQAEPGIELVARKARGDGRRSGEEGRALARGHPEDAHARVLRVRNR